MLPGGATRLAQLEYAMQKQAHVLTELQTPLRTETTPQSHVHWLAAKVEQLDMQLAELCTRVQADDQARELLSRLSGYFSLFPLSFPQATLLAAPGDFNGSHCIFAGRCHDMAHTASLHGDVMTWQHCCNIRSGYC